MSFLGKGKPLTQAAFDATAAQLGVNAAKLWAVFEVESKRCGFWADRRAVILFERHKFYGYTKGPIDEEICHPKAGNYGPTGKHQYDKLARAVKINREAALKSTSWGLGQVMGFNAKLAGFLNAEDMVAQMCDNEDAQLRGMATFVKALKLDAALRVENWAAFAKGYNGADYAKNSYDTRLRAAYLKYSNGPLPDMEGREAQILLTYLGYGPLVVDGWPGQNTVRALNQFRKAKGLPEVKSFSDAELPRLRKAVYG